ncbi:hypothetical protein VTK26DRAFT_3308 [Humicola hyalothermophila]
MSIPEDTVTTPLGCASPPTVSGGILESDDDDAQTEGPASRTSPEWEEPHPGKRYLYTVAENVRPGAGNCNQSCNGGSKTGMTAKSYAPYPVAAPRRFARPRIRTPSSRGLKIPRNASHESKRPRLSLETTQSTASSTAPIMGSQTHSDAAASPLYGCKSGNVVVRHCHCSSQLSMTDFSGFLKTPADPPVAVFRQDSDEASSYLSVDVPEPPSPLPHAAVDEDPYGWDAELDRRLTYSHHHHHHPGGAKRSLLQRVLSRGPREPMR